MSRQELRIKIAEQVSKRLLPPPLLKSSPNHSSPTRIRLANKDLDKYLKNSAQTFKNLNGKAFIRARKFYKSPSPERLAESPRRSSSRKLKLPIELEFVIPEVMTERKSTRSKTPWATGRSTFLTATSRESPELTSKTNSPISRLKTLDTLITDITSSNIKEQRSYSSNIRQGKKSYSKLKKLMELTRDKDLIQFKE